MSPAQASERALVDLARTLGSRAHDWAILAEGNVSCLEAEATVVVKASGVNMADAEPDDFVRAPLTDLIALVDDSRSTDEDVAALFGDVARRSGGKRPSVESLLHAVCLDQSGVVVAGHTHPISVNSLACSRQANLLVGGALFPDQIVVLGADPLLVPYVDPGLELARHVRRELRRRDTAPRVIYLANHGMFALGSTASQVVQITEMADKFAQILLGTLPAGGPAFMTDADVRRIDTRPDEVLRRASIAARA